jgi:DNA-binding Lrp family transcriptional regulator
MKQGNLSFGSEAYIKEETGERVVAQTVYQEATDSNFEKIWLAHVLVSLNELGNKKIRILGYLFKNRIVSHNIVPKTVQDIANETGISYPTVLDTIKILEKNGLIKRKTGKIYLDPGMIFKGTHDNRMRIMFEFRNINTNTTPEEEQEPSPEPKQLKAVTAADLAKIPGFTAESKKPITSIKVPKAPRTGV